MIIQERVFTPGKILHDSIAGALLAQGSSLGRWCKNEGVSPTIAKLATHGQMSGPRGVEIVDALIQSAGFEQVELSYRMRTLAEADKFRAAHRPQQIAA